MTGMRNIDFTYDFPLWTIVSWVLIAALFIVAFRMRKAIRNRLEQVEGVVYGRSLTEEPNWEYENYHRAASEMMLRAVNYPDTRFARLSEAQEYACKAIERAQTDDQKRFTSKLLEAIRVSRDEWTRCGGIPPSQPHPGGDS